jgi:Tn3 transposase DDE domain
MVFLAHTLLGPREVAYTEQRRQGGTINEDLLRHVAPLGWEHIGLTGDYVWSTAEPTAGRYAQTAAAAAIPTGGLSSGNVPDVVESEHFRAVTEAGNRRLDSPKDFVRIEIATALQRDIPVIPILLDGASIPKADQQPEDLKPTSSRRAVSRPLCAG